MTPQEQAAQIVHELKTWPEYYQHLVDGTKTFEYRRDDRGFKVGDVLHLREWQVLPFSAPAGRYTGREIRRRVTYLLKVAEDFVVMALEPEAIASALAEQQTKEKEEGSTRMDSLLPIEPPQPAPTDRGLSAEFLRTSARPLAKRIRQGEIGDGEMGLVEALAAWACEIEELVRYETAPASALKASEFAWPQDVDGLIQMAMDWEVPEGEDGDHVAADVLIFKLGLALTAVQHERDEYRTLAKVGVWHNGCRPNREMAARELAKSQAVIDKLADRISELEDQVRALSADLVQRTAEQEEAQAEANDWRTVYDELVILLGLDPHEGDRNEAVIRLAALTQQRLSEKHRLCCCVEHVGEGRRCIECAIHGMQPPKLEAQLAASPRPQPSADKCPRCGNPDKVNRDTETGLCSDPWHETSCPQQSAGLHDAITALIAAWRERATVDPDSLMTIDDWGHGNVLAYRTCADELAALRDASVPLCRISEEEGSTRTGEASEATAALLPHSPTGKA